MVGRVSDTGEVLLQRGEEVPYDGHAPRPSQKPLPGETTHVRHVGVMDGEAENSVTWMWNMLYSTLKIKDQFHDLHRPYLSISVHHRMSSLLFM